MGRSLRLYAVKLIKHREVGVMMRGRKKTSVMADSWLGTATKPRRVVETLRDAHKFQTRKSAENAAFLLVSTLPALLGKVEVREAVPYQTPSNTGWRWTSKAVEER